MTDVLDEAERLLRERFEATSTPDQQWRVHPADPCRVVGDHLVPIADARLAAHAALIARAPTLIADIAAELEAERKRRALLLDAVSEYLSYRDQHCGDDYFETDRRRTRMKLDDAIDAQVADELERGE